MYELEVLHDRLPAGVLPPDVRERFTESRSYTHLGLLNWEEHCTECAWPSCYTTCDLYNPRNDGNCRRTIDGFSPVPDAPILGGHVVRVRFGQWCNLTTRCRLSLPRVLNVRRTESRLNWAARLASRFPHLGRVIRKPGLPGRITRRLKNRMVASRSALPTAEPTCFVIEVYNPSPRVVELSLTIVAFNSSDHPPPFMRLLPIEQGFHRVQIPYAEIRPHLGNASETYLSINPNILEKTDEGLPLYFGLMTFATDPAMFAQQEPVPNIVKEKKVKVVIWDLDNTVWAGTLIEDGPGTVVLRPGIREVIEGLDARGIVNSVVSKNHEEAAFAELSRFGLRDYFVFPRIGWGPKSESVRGVIKAFNVGADTVAFVDDQPFERQEVRAGNPKVRVYTHEEATSLLGRDEFDVPATDEAKGRRAFYQTEEQRQHVFETSGGDYLAFLRDSDIRVRIVAANHAHIDRIHELVQRTNQLNFSGNRYTRSDLLVMASDTSREIFLADAVDKYGKYGYIGFAIVSSGPTPRVVDLAFSCRIQSKRVEHAVLAFLMRTSAMKGASQLEVFYRATDRNLQLAKVFPDLGFVEMSRAGADFIYSRRLETPLPEVPEVTVIFDKVEATVGGVA